MKFADSRINRRLYIIAAKPRISPTRSVAYHQPQAVYHQREALHQKRCLEGWTKGSRTLKSAVGCISSRRSRVYHQREALHIISHRLYIINAKRCIKNGVQKDEQKVRALKNQPQAVYHRGEAAYIINAKRCILSAIGCISPTRSVASKNGVQKAEQKVRAL